MYVTYIYTYQLDLEESSVRKYIIISLKYSKCYNIFAVIHSFCSAYKTFFYSRIASPFPEISPSYALGFIKNVNDLKK